MVHNTPNCPILSSPTKSTVGPGAYNVAIPARPSTQEDMNYIMMPQHVSSFVSSWCDYEECSNSMALYPGRWIGSGCQV